MKAETPKTTNGDAIKNEETSAKEQKKSWWDRQDDGVKAILATIGGLGAFVIGCVAVGVVADTVRSANQRAILNSPGFKNALERGLLDPVPPPKTLEEAAARIIDASPRMLPMDSLAVVPIDHV